MSIEAGVAIFGQDKIFSRVEIPDSGGSADVTTQTSRGLTKIAHILHPGDYYLNKGVAPVVVRTLLPNQVYEIGSLEEIREGRRFPLVLGSLGPDVSDHELVVRKT